MVLDENAKKVKQSPIPDAAREMQVSALMRGSGNIDEAKLGSGLRYMSRRDQVQSKSAVMDDLTDCYMPGDL